MMVLTRLTGQPVRALDGAVLGRLIDLTARLGDEHPQVHRLVVGRRHRVSHLVPWEAVASFDASEVALRDDATAYRVSAGGGALDLEEDELLLGRDVRDVQIVDIAGRRLARVSDVVLTGQGGTRLDVAAVDVGMGAVWRRLGLRRIGERVAPQLVDWSDLHLTSDRGHTIQLATTTAAVHRLDARGLAELLTRLDLGSATDVVRRVGPARAAEALSHVHPQVGGRLIAGLGPGEAATLLDELPEQTAHRLRRRLAARSPLSGRRFRRLHGWRRNPPGQSGGPRAAVPGP